MKIRILQPYRLDTPDALMARAEALVQALVAAHPEHDFDLVREPGAARPGIGPEKYAAHADVRNQLVERLPPDIDAVLWIDIDLIAYPADFVRRALALNPLGIMAPAVLLEGTNTFYDIGGFVQGGGVPFSPRPPYARVAADVHDLESVGCMYLAPAFIYRDWGLRYRPDGPVYGVEHHSVCSVAAQRGVPVKADMRMVATHAYLPRYGRPLS